METSPQFYAALAKAQSEFLPIHRDKTVKVRMKAGGEYTFAYAPLESILAAVLPALNAHGFALVQQVEGEPQYTEGGPPRGEYIATVLYHEHGWISNRVRIIINEPGPQAYGSALTYARRYSVTLLLSVCADEDEDGNIANGNTPTTVREKGHIDPRGDLSGVDNKLRDKHVKAITDILNADKDEMDVANMLRDYKATFLQGHNELFIATADELSRQKICSQAKLKEWLRLGMDRREHA